MLPFMAIFLTPFCMLLYKTAFDLQSYIPLVFSGPLSPVSWLVGWNHDDSGHIIGTKPFTLINTKCPRFYLALRHFTTAIIKNICFLSSCIAAILSFWARRGRLSKGKGLADVMHYAL